MLLRDQPLAGVVVSLVEWPACGGQPAHGDFMVAYEDETFERFVWPSHLVDPVDHSRIRLGAPVEHDGLRLAFVWDVM